MKIFYRPLAQGSRSLRKGGSVFLSALILSFFLIPSAHAQGVPCSYSCAPLGENQDYPYDPTYPSDPGNPYYPGSPYYPGNPYDSYPPGVGGVRGQFGRIVRDQHYIYVYTPWKEMWNEAKREVVDHTLGRLRQQLDVFSKKAGKMVDGFTRSRALDKILFESIPYLSLAGEPGLRLSSLAPTGLMFYVGGKFSAGLKISGGGSIALGVVVVPMVVHRISIEPRNVQLPDGESVLRRTVTRYITLDWTIVGMPALNIGVGAGGGVGKRIGLGFIWGPLYNADDFFGPYLAASQTFVKGVGINAKAGIVYNPRTKNKYPFMMAALETGPTAAISLHVNAFLVSPLDDVFRMIGLPPMIGSGYDYRYYPTGGIYDPSYGNGGYYDPGNGGGYYDPGNGGGYYDPGSGSGYDPSPDPLDPDPVSGGEVPNGPALEVSVEFKPPSEAADSVIDERTIYLDADQILKEIGCDPNEMSQCGLEITIKKTQKQRR